MFARRSRVAAGFLLSPTPTGPRASYNRRPECWREGDGVGSGTQPAFRRSTCAEDGRVPGSVGRPVRMKPPASARKAPLRVSGKPTCSMPSSCAWMCNAVRDGETNHVCYRETALGGTARGGLRRRDRYRVRITSRLFQAELVQAGFGYRVNEEQRTSLGMCSARS